MKLNLDVDKVAPEVTGERNPVDTRPTAGGRMKKGKD